jgi:hypothetical protein
MKREDGFNVQEAVPYFASWQGCPHPRRKAGIFGDLNLLG